MIKVLLVDDSAVIRAMIRQVMQLDGRFEIAGEASNGEIAVKSNEIIMPDLIIMDINMPIMDGLEATKRILSVSSPSIIIFSTEENAAKGYLCIKAGALEMISKPNLSIMTQNFMKIFCDRIVALCEKHNFGNTIKKVSSVPFFYTEKNEKPYINSLLNQSNRKYHILLVGASTGGPAALQQLFSGLGSDFPLPVLVTQHIDASFDTHFAEWLNESTEMTVEIAKAGLIPQKGHVYIAPADKHLVVISDYNSSSGCLLDLSDDPPVHFLKPSVDKLFLSAAEVFGKQVIAVLLTGMGKDGADGCKRIVDRGGYTIAEAESSCAVFGMPRAAIEAGAASAVVSLDHISQFLKSRISGNAYE